MAVTRIIAPTILPVSLSEFRQHLWNIFDNHNTDALMTDLLQAATDRVENDISRKLISQTWRTTMSGDATGIVLPFGGFQSVVHASWFDGLVWTDIAAADIEVDDSWTLAVVDCNWPDADIRKGRIDWVCGYGPASADVPGDLRMAVKQLAAHWYRMRSATTIETDDGRAMPVPFNYTALVSNHQLHFVG